MTAHQHSVIAGNDSLGPLDTISVQVLSAFGLPNDEAQHLERLSLEFTKTIEPLGLLLEKISHGTRA